MILQLIKAFVIFALLPVIFFTVAMSFVMNDISVLNPFNWVIPARFAVMVWVGTVFLAILGEISDAN